MAVGAVALLFGFVTLMMTYFRLLGRLAWVLMQEIEVEVAEDEVPLGGIGADDETEISLGV